MSYIFKIIAVLLFFTNMVHATTMVKMDIPDLTKNSSKILVGKVKRIFTEKQDGIIYTYVVMNVGESIYNADSDNEVVIVQSGGKYEDKVMKVFGAPEFSVDERSMVFLTESSLKPGKSEFLTGNEKMVEIVGLAQGKYNVLTNVNDGLNYIMKDTMGMSLLNPVDMKFQVKNQKKFTKLEDMVKEIKKYLPNKGSK